MNNLELILLVIFSVWVIISVSSSIIKNYTENKRRPLFWPITVSTVGIMIILIIIIYSEIQKAFVLGYFPLLNMILYWVLKISVWMVLIGVAGSITIIIFRFINKSETKNS